MPVNDCGNDLRYVPDPHIEQASPSKVDTRLSHEFCWKKTKGRVTLVAQPFASDPYPILIFAVHSGASGASARGI